MAKTIDAYLPDFRIDAAADGKLARRILALSVGRAGHRTPLFEQGGIAPREKLHISSKYPPPHGGAEMPFALFFHKAGRPDLAGCAFHQGDTFISSHGCVHLDRADAEWLFSWVGKETVTLSVHGPYPPSPTRAHLYKLAAPDMLARVIALINGRLADLGYLPGPVGTTYDAATADAVRRFQADRHLTADGAVGPRETAPALGITLNSRPIKRTDMADEADAANNQPAGYVPDTVWTWDRANGGTFASINRPVSGATHEKELPVGKHPFQLYSLGTPNGQKVTILLEELLAAGHSGAEYDAWLIKIADGDQFSSGFVAINPNSKIPAMMDHSTDPPTRLFESGSMLVYLAEKFGAFLPTGHHKRAETMNWLMWQMGSAPFVGGGFGHFYAYAPFKMKYPIDRFAMETKRQLHVLDTHLADREYMVGNDYTIADIAIWPWYGAIMREAYSAQQFLSVGDYPHLSRWVDQIAGREAVKRGRRVNRTFGPPETQLAERHDASDFAAIAEKSES